MSEHNEFSTKDNLIKKHIERLVETEKAQFFKGLKTENKFGFHNTLSKKDLTENINIKLFMAKLVKK